MKKIQCVVWCATLFTVVSTTAQQVEPLTEVEQAIVKYTHLPEDIPRSRIIRVSSDTHQKLRTLSFMSNTSMTTIIDEIIDEHVEKGMTIEERSAMWKIMSARVTSARERD